MSTEYRIAIMSDIHGEHRVLERILNECRESEVQRIVLLGDLFDRYEQIDACLQRLSGWPLSGVIGNHEREALKSECPHKVSNDGQASTLIAQLGDRLLLGDALFIHDHLEWKPAAEPGEWSPRVVFAGHTHYRHARDESGPIDISLGHIKLRENRRYLINPGAVVEGQFAIWDRYESRVLFKRV
jgi:predicted phosphodiesterase